MASKAQNLRAARSYLAAIERGEAAEAIGALLHADSEKGRFVFQTVSTRGNLEESSEIVHLPMTEERWR